MKKASRILVCGLVALCGSMGLAQYQSLRDQNEVLFRQLQSVHGLSDAQMNAVRHIFTESGYVGQGNPAISRHPVTPEACQAKLKALGVSYENPQFEKICKAKYMAPLYDPSSQRAEDALACIDQFLNIVFVLVFNSQANPVPY